MKCDIRQRTSPMTELPSPPSVELALERGNHLERGRHMFALAWQWLPVLLAQIPTVLGHGLANFNLSSSLTRNITIVSNSRSQRRQLTPPRPSTRRVGNPPSDFPFTREDFVSRRCLREFSHVHQAGCDETSTVLRRTCAFTTDDVQSCHPRKLISQYRSVSQKSGAQTLPW
jgi:hypothetical protein